MNTIFIRLFFIFSILWGVGYPFQIRYPIYIFISPLILLSSNKFQNFKISNFINLLSSSWLVLARDFIFSKKILFLVFLGLYFFIWKPYGLVYLISLFTFVFCLRKAINFEEICEKDWIYTTALLTLIIVGFSIPFVGSFHQNVPASQGLYPEPSNLGFSLGPVLGLLTRKKKYSFFGIIGIIFFYLFSYSKSLLIGYFFSLLFSWRFKYKPKSQLVAITIISFLVIIISVKSFFMIGIENLNENQIAYGVFGSSLVWFYWLKNSIIYLLNNPLGLGPFGWLQNGLEIPFEIPECNYKSLCKVSGEFITTLNQRDMASLVAFGSASFGFLFPPYLFLILNRICKNTLKTSAKYFQFDPISILLLSYICTYMFRWTGFTAGPLLGLLCLMPKKDSKNFI